MFGKIKLGLALGGGAARGMAHIGVLRMLEENKVPINLIVGTSIGALVGGLYATTGDIAHTEQRLLSFLDSPTFLANRFDFIRELRKEQKSWLGSLRRMLRRGLFIGYSFSRQSFISAQQFERNINHLLDDVDIEQARIPFASVSCDLRRGEELIISSGPIRRAVSASSAIPGILPPVEWNGKLLVDGGWTAKVPVLSAFRMGADAVIGVDISAEVHDTRKLTRGYDIFIRASAITDSILKRMQCRMADVLIRPEVGSIHWADFGRSRECIDAGHTAAREKMDEIRSLLRHERLTQGLLPTRGRRIARHFLKTKPEDAQSS
jgi:NTE family protein